MLSTSIRSVCMRQTITPAYSAREPVRLQKSTLWILLTNTSKQTWACPFNWRVNRELDGEALSLSSALPTSLASFRQQAATGDRA